jgi:hypothetical protein
MLHVALLGLLRFTPAEMPHSAAVSIATSTLSGGAGHGVAAQPPTNIELARDCVRV